ncbi:helix-turn-helix domain-containing protein [Lactococcus raffinolactis]|uniref:helix-turn-helix domain-containing protein n=1 Tax=Pseudolactococcus raffinolactis TaxID=1366 RepID=UPI0039A0A632
MLRNRLAVLLAQKQIKISRMALDTGLSRTTLTALSQNDSKRIDNDTLNTILMYLQITPNDFFNFLSYDFEVKITPSEFNFSYDKEIGNNEKNEYLSIEKGIFDLFIRIYDKVSTRTPVYEFKLHVEKSHKYIQIKEEYAQVDYDEWEVIDSVEKQALFELIGEKDKVEDFQRFLGGHVPIDFQEELTQKIIVEFKECIKKSILEKQDLKSTAVDYLVEKGIDIVSYLSILNFLPF